MTDEMPKTWDEQVAEVERAAHAARERWGAAAALEAPPSPLTAPLARPANVVEDLRAIGTRIAAMAAVDLAAIEARQPHTTCRDCGTPLRGPTRCQQCERTRSIEAREQARFESIPETFRWARFDATELPEYVPNAVATQAARAAVGAPRVLLVGRTGMGKTSLAAAMMREWLGRHSLGVAFFAMGPTLARASWQHGFGKGEFDAMARALSATLLVLDELPSDAPPSGFSAIQTLIYERHAKGLPTWVTTWMSPKDVSARYDKGLTRRLFENAEVIDCGST
jgi:DNA replication protein DnaC